jgi:MYXO-CTERM domain-containing protein
LFAGALALGPGAVAAEQILAVDGTVDTGGPDHLQVPFTVPDGVAEIEVDHQNLDDANVLDFGVRQPDGGSRGWGGGNTEAAIFAVGAASRSYHTGEIPAGTWTVDIGKAKLAHTPAPFHLEIHLRDTPSLAAQPERSPYQPAPALKSGPGWYAGDFHVHSKESGDAHPTLDEIATFARGRGLDFVELSDHNTTSQLDFINAAQARHRDLLFLPGFEFTTYHGHANAIGGTRWVDPQLGIEGKTIQDAIDQIHAQGALFSINHPVLELPGLCIGCAWDLYVAPREVDAVEIANGGWSETGSAFDLRAIDFWTELCRGQHPIAAIGGSDDHRGGEGTGSLDSPIGDPTTMVWADGLSAAAIQDGVRQGRTVVKLQGPGDPMIELDASKPRDGSFVHATRAHLSATVTGGQGDQLVWVENGERADPIDITSDPFVATREVPAPPGGAESFWRAEVWTDGHPITVTSHLWVMPPLPDPALTEEAPAGCGCATTTGRQGGGILAALLGLLALASRRRATSRPS